MKLKFLKHMTRFVAKNDPGITIDFPGGPHVKMRLFVRILPCLYIKTDITSMHNIKCELHADEVQEMVDRYIKHKTK